MARNSTGGRRPSGGGDELLWLETYFISFPASRRPSLTQVEQALVAADPRLRLENVAANSAGLFESILIESPEDHAAVEVSYETGDAVIVQNLAWAEQMRDRISTKQFQLLASADARLDVAHFERIQQEDASARSKRQSLRDEAESDRSDAEDFTYVFDGDFDVEAAMEIFDPTCLLTVVEALEGLTKGITIDPAAGEAV